MKGRVKNLKREKTMHPEFVDNMKKCVNPKDKVNPNNPDNLDEISKSEIAAVHRFLVAEVRPFSQEVIAESQLRMLLGRPENIVYGKSLQKKNSKCFEMFREISKLQKKKNLT